MIKNTILLQVIRGKAVHSFVTEADAKLVLEDIQANGVGGMSFSINDGMEASLIYDISPDLQARVESGKKELARQVKFNDELDRQDVPKDRSLRSAIYKAFKNLNTLPTLH